MKEFCKSVVDAFGAEVLRAQTGEDLEKLERQFGAVRFPGCIGCLDCSGWL